MLRVLVDVVPAAITGRRAVAGHGPVRAGRAVVTCRRWQEAISAIADGEDPGLDAAPARRPPRPMRRLPRLRSRSSRPTAGATLVRPAEAQPDLAPRVAKWAAVLDRAGRWSVVRAVLGIVALEIIAFSLPALVLGDEHHTSAHAARHLGAFTAAYGVGLLVVVARPARARAMLPVAAVLAGALVITAVVDLIDGQVPLLGESQHLPEVLSVVLVWLLAVPSPRRAARRASPASKLRLVPRRPGRRPPRRLSPARAGRQRPGFVVQPRSTTSSSNGSPTKPRTASILMRSSLAAAVVADRSRRRAIDGRISSSTTSGEPDA